MGEKEGAEVNDITTFLKLRKFKVPNPVTASQPVAV